MGGQRPGAGERHEHTLAQRECLHQEMTQEIQYLVVVLMFVPDREGELKVIGLHLSGETHDQIRMDFLSGLEADFTGIRLWEGFYNVVQDEFNVPGLELGSNHLAELDGVYRVEDKGMTVDDGNLLILRGETDKGDEGFITSRKGLTGYSSLNSPASSER